MRNIPAASELGEIALFQGLTLEELNAIRPSMEQKEFPANTTVLSSSQRGGSVYFLRTGTVKICSEGWSGVDVIITIIGAGQMLGELHLVDGLGHSANAVTLERCTLMWMDSEAFHRFRRAMPVLNENLLKLLATRSRFTTDRLQVLASKSVGGRLASQLLSFGANCGVPQPDGSILIPMRVRQSELAQLIGASRQHTNVTFASFRDRGLVSMNDDNRIVIKNAAMLERCE